MARILIVCSECGSTDVTRDATASWDFNSQTWELAGVQDQGSCNECGEERSLEEIEPPEAEDAYALLRAVRQAADGELTDTEAQKVLHDTGY
jgi:hypothetical protein